MQCGAAITPYGVSAYPGLNYVSLAIVLYKISCNIGPQHNGTRLFKCALEHTPVTCAVLMDIKHPGSNTLSQQIPNNARIRPTSFWLLSFSQA